MSSEQSSSLWRWVVQPAMVAVATLLVAHNWLQTLPPLVAHAVAAPMVEAAFVFSVAFGLRTVPFLLRTRLGRVGLAVAAGLAVALAKSATALAASTSVQFVVGIAVFGVLVVHAGLTLVAVQGFKGVSVDAAHWEPVAPWEEGAWHGIALSSTALGCGMLLVASWALLLVPTALLGVVLHQSLGTSVFVSVVVAALAGLSVVLVELKAANVVIERARAAATPADANLESGPARE